MDNRIHVKRLVKGDCFRFPFRDVVYTVDSFDSANGLVYYFVEGNRSSVFYRGTDKLHYTSGNSEVIRFY